MSTGLKNSITIDSDSSKSEYYYSINLGFMDFNFLVQINSSKDFVITDINNNEVLATLPSKSFDVNNNLRLQMGVFDFNDDGVNELVISHGTSNKNSSIFFYEYSLIDNNFQMFDDYPLLPCDNSFLTKFSHLTVEIPFGFDVTKYQSHNIIPNYQYAKKIDLSFIIVDEWSWRIITQGLNINQSLNEIIDSGSYSKISEGNDFSSRTYHLTHSTTATGDSYPAKDILTKDSIPQFLLCPTIGDCGYYAIMQEEIFKSAIGDIYFYRPV